MKVSLQAVLLFAAAGLTTTHAHSKEDKRKGLRTNASTLPVQEEDLDAAVSSKSEGHLMTIFAKLPFTQYFEITLEKHRHVTNLAVPWQAVTPTPARTRRTVIRSQNASASNTRTRTTITSMHSRSLRRSHTDS